MLSASAGGEGASAPAIHAEPVFSPDDANTISWSPVAGAVAYYVQVATDAGFSSVVGKSGWVSSTSHTFTGLADGATYHYRVAARIVSPNNPAAVTVTESGDFSTGTLDDAVVDQDGHVTIEPGQEQPTSTYLDTLGNTADDSTSTSIDGRFNAFVATTDATLTKLEMYLGITSSVMLQFAVFESVDGAGPYTLIAQKTLSSSGTGTKWYSSGAMEVQLVEGRHYYIGAAWKGSSSKPVKFYSNNYQGVYGVDWNGVSTSFGLFYGRMLVSLPNLPIDTDLGQPLSNSRLYHMRATTVSGGGGSGASTGSVTTQAVTLAQGQSWHAFTFTGVTPAGTYLSAAVLNGAGQTIATIPSVMGNGSVEASIDLSAINDATLRIRISLHGNANGNVPTLHDWALTRIEYRDEHVSAWSSPVASMQMYGLGDFDSDQARSADDIDALVEAVANGQYDARFDLNGDGHIDAKDIDHLVYELIGTEYGDVNLDGVIDAADLLLLAGNFGGSTGWAGGDVAGKGGVTITDLAKLAAHMGYQAEPKAAGGGTSAIESEPIDLLAEADDAPASSGAVIVLSPNANTTASPDDDDDENPDPLADLEQIV